MYEKTCELLYEMISARIRTRRADLKLTNKQICPNADPLIISAIVNNTRNNKKNFYLIPDGTRGTNSSIDRTPLINVIASNLKFNSISELILGNDKEITCYSGKLFSQLVLDTLSYTPIETDNKIKPRIAELNATMLHNKDLIDSILFNYIPYAKKSIFYDLNEKYGDITLYLCDGKLIADVDDCIYEQRLAISRLFNITKDEFINSFHSIFINQPNTTKLNRRLLNYVTNDFIPMLQRNILNNIVITDALSMLEKCSNQLIYYSNESTTSSPEIANYHESALAIYERDNISLWFDAALNYINALEDIQMQSEGIPNIHLLESTWNSNICTI